ncbi:hypothetical protein ABZ419_20340 [Streptomyces cinnamoneus]|uniref:hypothetical protein n=1 Tax=Streptomyces cinnamoneus TaxID=53446 RepID=UPI0033DF4E1A
MGLLAGTTTYYRQLRPGIPDDVAVVLDQAAPARPDGRRRLLDAGTATGLVAEALLSRFVQRAWTAESILGYLYSTSFAAPHLFATA